MSYLFSKGNRLFGDIEFEDDTNTQIDFEDDYIGLVAGGSTILAVSGSKVCLPICLSSIEPSAFCILAFMSPSM